MWILWALVVLNQLRLYFDAVLPEPGLFAGLVVNAGVAIIIRAVSEGRRWARITYVFVSGMSLLPLLATPSPWLEMSNGERALSTVGWVTSLAIIGALFWPGSGRWFSSVDVPRRLFLPSLGVKVLIYNFWLAGLGSGAAALSTIRGWEPSILVTELQFLHSLSAVPSLVAARWLHRRQQDRIQSERNSRAREREELAAAPSDSRLARSVRPYVLYLRPFATVGRLPFAFAAADRSFADNYLYGAKFDLESWLGKVAREGLPSWNVYAIGDLGGGVGADKIHTRDEDWMRLFALLSAQAYVLFMCPLDRPGTRWEIDAILGSSDLLRKTIFALPPPRRFGGADIAAMWEQTRRRVSPTIPAFPAFGSGCTLFALRAEDLAVLELQRGPVDLKRFKALVLGLKNSYDIEALWHDAPADIQARLPSLLRDLATLTGPAEPIDGLVITKPVNLHLDGFTLGSKEPALQWLIQCGLVLVEREATLLDPTLVRLHPALLAWTRAQTWALSNETAVEPLGCPSRQDAPLS